ncbi:LPXTG cell wall anchor domain-containing protein [Streptococcus iniae]|uniref:SspB-related isopeptide-forming adhesin n=1 Tax=Streptococcus iniae TaxID=1346 RepID=UPI00030F11DE|nr:SspB-related isopeptide-forming adhesin [Streptococcus iniae]ESR10146.1 cell wall surface anchor protein [Streptococcus iniae IUSA1]KYJ82914.1 cell surface protein [Streptococcus iniae]RLV28631.1 LPXTG cell wall anchor domain-containing protein [Streptococcus iniae]RMI76819.1 LPXTG cell wall anchor domain-containing protein [Streptococcus iniae]HEK4517168.1 LPXTG cell wall anchor domain-containing protein [Streptococcus iniae]
MNLQIKGHGIIRKSKAYGLVCGIALAGVFAFGSTQVNADEVTAPTADVVTTLTAPTTNKAQTVTSRALDTAVAEASKSGVNVTTTAPVSHADETSAKADLANQTQAVKDATAKAQANTQAIKTATDTNAQIDAQNKAEADRVAQENKAGQLAVDQRNAQGKAQVDQANKNAQAQADATNAKLKADYEAKLAEIKTVEDYNKAVVERNALAKQQADATNAQAKAEYDRLLAIYNQAIKAKAQADAQSITNVAFDIKTQAQGVDNTEYGNSIMTATSKADGSFEFDHDMIDGVKTIGYGKLTGKVNHHYVSNSDGSVTAYIDSVTIYKYEYRNVAPNSAVNQNIVFRILTKDGNVVYEKPHNGNNTFSDTLNKTLDLNLKYDLQPHATSGNVEVFKLHDDWVHDTHGSALVSYVNNNDAVPAVVIPDKPVPPTLVTVTPEPTKPVPPTPVTPTYVTPSFQTFTPSVYTPIKATVKPHVTVPEKLNVTVSVHPVLVPVANPSKDVVDQLGKSINGLSVLPNSTLNYVAKQNFSQYKGMTASQDKVAKNFVMIDDYKDDALDGQSMVVNAIKASDGTDVSQLLEMRHVLSKDALDDKLKALLAESGLSPVGEFYMWTAKDPQAFYKAYVQKGLDITYNLSFKVNQSFSGGEIVNGVAQIDFGNGYLGNIAVNDLTTPEVHKDVLDKEDGKSINNGTVKLGDEVTYKLEGWVVPTGRSYDLFEYKFVDQLQQTHDLYLKDKVLAKVDITLSDGTVITKGSDLAQYTETVYNKETGRYELAFKADFLAKVSRESEFGADAFVVVKRVKAGDVYNDYTLYVNGNPVLSNKVVTHTPEKPKPVTPQKAVPKAPSLPHTGEASVTPLTVLGAVMLSVFGLLSLTGSKDKKYFD